MILCLVSFFLPSPFSMVLRPVVRQNCSLHGGQEGSREGRGEETVRGFLQVSYKEVNHAETKMKTQYRLTLSNWIRLRGI